MPLTAEELKWQPLVVSPRLAGAALLGDEELGLDTAEEEVGIELLVRDDEVRPRVHGRARRCREREDRGGEPRGERHAPTMN